MEDEWTVVTYKKKKKTIHPNGFTTQATCFLNHHITNTKSTTMTEYRRYAPHELLGAKVCDDKRDWKKSQKSKTKCKKATKIPKSGASFLENSFFCRNRT